MKKTHSKIAAALSAAVLAVSGASALQASAVSLSPVSQNILLHEPSAMSMYLHVECGLRFLTDYLDGDHYFGTAYPGQNLDRARSHIKLVRDMEKKWDEMERIIREI